MQKPKEYTPEEQEEYEKFAESLETFFGELTYKLLGEFHGGSQEGLAEGSVEKPKEE